MHLKRSFFGWVCFAALLIGMLSTLSTSAFAKSECLEEKKTVIDQQHEIYNLKTEVKVCKASKSTITDKLGVMVLGGFVVYTQFHWAAILGAGYVAIFQ